MAEKGKDMMLLKKKIAENKEGPYSQGQLERGLQWGVSRKKRDPSGQWDPAAIPAASGTPSILMSSSHGIGAFI